MYIFVGHPIGGGLAQLILVTSNDVGQINTDRAPEMTSKNSVLTVCLNKPLFVQTNNYLFEQEIIYLNKQLQNYFPMSSLGLLRLTRLLYAGPG